MVGMVERTETALAGVEEMLPAGFPEVVWLRVAAGVRARRERFHLGLTADSDTDTAG
jgi:hypothetical protein